MFYQTLFIDYYFDTILSTQLSVMTLLIMTLHGQVPFLVNNKEKWISGIVEETTCGDVVKVIFFNIELVDSIGIQYIF